MSKQTKKKPARAKSKPAKAQKGAPSADMIKKCEEEIAKLAQRFADDPSMSNIALDTACKEIATRHNVRIGTVRGEVQAAYQKIVEAAKAEAKQQQRSGVHAGCEESAEIVRRWPPWVGFYDRASDIPQTLDAFEWPLDPLLDVPFALEAMSREWAVVKLVNKTRYAYLGGLKDGKGIDFMQKQDFVNLHEKRNIRIEGDDEGDPKELPLTKTWLRHPSRRDYKEVTFCPDCGDVSQDVLNLFIGLAKTPAQGDWSLMRNHIFENVCRKNDEHFRWLMAWMAQILQAPADKQGSAVCLRGLPGTGKTIVGLWLRRIIGKAHAHEVTQRSHITGKFNAHMAVCILLCIEEGFWAGDKEAESVMKTLITGSELAVEGKGENVIFMPNFTRVFQTTNEDWAVPAGVGDRRWFVLDVADTHRKDTAYFKAIEEQMLDGGAEAMMHDLLEYPWWEVDLRNPPKTDAHAEQVAHGLTGAPAWLRDALIEGGFTFDGTFVSFAQEGGKIEKSKVAKSVGDVIGGRWKPNQLTSRVTTDLKKLIPALNALAKMSDSGRAPAYEFPPLDAMRRRWEEMYNEAPWGGVAPGFRVS